ncbi:hypothetical protein FAGKG844_70034 [Frankia sp. AgKG'84/4]
MDSAPGLGPGAPRPPGVDPTGPPLRSVPRDVATTRTAADIPDMSATAHGGGGARPPAILSAGVSLRFIVDVTNG